MFSFAKTIRTALPHPSPKTDGACGPLVFVHVSDTDLARRITCARESITLYSSGIGEKVAEALVEAIRRLGASVKVVLDVSQKSVDMGYLAPRAVERLWSECIDGGWTQFFHLSGLRLSALAVDDEPLLLFVTPAWLMEDENRRIVAACPSGMEVVAADVVATQALEEIPVDCERAGKICSQCLVPAKSLSEIKEDIKREGEQKVAAAEERAKEAEERAKNAGKKAVEDYKAQFKLRKIDFSVTSQPAKLEQRKLNIPPMFLVGLNNEVVKDLSAKYLIFRDGGKALKKVDGCEEFESLVAEIREKYLLCVTKYGSYARVCDMEEYGRDVERLRGLGKRVGERIRALLEKRINGVLERLYAQLEIQWRKSSTPWWIEYGRKDPKRKKLTIDDRRGFFLNKMKIGRNGTDVLVQKFVPTVRSVDAAVDEVLMQDRDFVKALEVAFSEREHAISQKTNKSGTSWPRTSVFWECPDRSGSSSASGQCENQVAVVCRRDDGSRDAERCGD